MIYRSIVIILLWGSALSVAAQESGATFVPPKPAGGSRAIGMTYHGIGFTSSQRNRLASAELELIFHVDTLGKAVLEEVKGIRDEGIIDSLRKRTPPPFVPASLNGKPAQSRYQYSLSYPFQSMYNVRCYGMIELSDVARLETSSQLEFAAGILSNVSTGEYLHPGFGYRLESVFRPKQKLGFGFAMGMYGSRLRKPYPTESSIALRSTALTVFFTGLATYPVYKSQKRETHLQLEMSYVGHSVAAKQREDENLHLHGYAPGVLVRYSLLLGRERLHYRVGNPATQSSRLEFHAAARSIMHAMNEASSFVIETGISYRLVGKRVTSLRMN